METFDIIIMGNGIMGYSTALQLLFDNPMLKIALIGKESRVGGASLAAGAMLGCFGEASDLCYHDYYHQKKLELSYEARQYWAEWLELINSVSSHKLPINYGTYILLNAKSGLLDDDNYHTILKLLNHYQEPYEKIDAKKISGYNPTVDARALDALYLPNEASVSSQHLFSLYESILSHNQRVTLINENITKIKANDYHIESVQTEYQKNYCAKQYLITAGVYSQQLIDQIPAIKNRIPRLFAGTGISLIMEKNDIAINQVIRTPNRSFACGLHVVPRNESTLYFGGTNNIHLHAEYMAKPAQLKFLIHCALQQINQRLHNNGILNILIGNRPVSFDTFPLLGKTSLPDLFIATGTYREGFLVAPLFAKYISQLMLEQREIFENPFMCERPPIATMTQQEAIKYAAKHYSSAAYETEIQLPPVGWHAMFEEMLTARISRLYQALGNDDFFIPADFLLLFDENEQLAINYFKKYLKEIKAVYPQASATLN